MIIFYFWVLVVGVMGEREEPNDEFMFCNLGKTEYSSYWRYYYYQVPVEEYKDAIHLQLGSAATLSCPIIPNLNIVEHFNGRYQLTCMRKSNSRRCVLYYCNFLRHIYISALLSALPDKLGSQDWKDKVTDIFEGVPGVQKWLNKSEEFWEGLQRPQDWKGETRDFLKNVTESHDLLGNFKKYFTGNITNPICEEEEEDDVRNSAYRLENLKVVLPCLAVVYILAVCAFFSFEVE